jgi:hypothetical protein
LDEAKFASYVADDIASVQATGKDLQVDGAALDPARVAEVLGPEQAQRWQQARDTARAVYSATAGLDKLTPDGLAEHLARIEPAPGAPGYVVAEKAHDAAVAQVKQIMQARAADPARAAEQAFPELQGLAEDAAKRKDGMKDVVTARLRAQTALGIEPMAQAPLTNNEVAPYVARLRMYAGAQDGGLDGELSRVAAELRNVYGDHADEVFAQVLHARGVGKETSKIGASFLQQLSLDQPLDYVSDAIRSTAAVQMQGAQARDVSSGGIMGVIPMFDGARVPAVPAWLQRATAVHAEGRAKPTAADVDALRKYPETLAASFDQRFGKNASAIFLTGADGAPLRRKLPDGTIELTYNSGYVEMLRPDGTVEGKAGKR